MRSPKVWITATTPGISSRPVAVCRNFTSERTAERQSELRSFAGKAAHGIAAIQVLLDDILDYRTEIPVLFLEPVLIFS